MSLSLLLEIARNHGLKEIRDEIQELQADDQVYIGFLGDFSSGKSTLINALVNQSDLLPVSVEPCTGSAAYIRADPAVTAPTFFVVDDSGATRATDRGSFDDFVRGVSRGTPLAHVPPGDGFPNAFVFVDTPGLGALLEAHQEVTLCILPMLDAAVICVDAAKGGLSQSVLSFLSAPCVHHLQSRFLLAITRADELPPAARDRIAGKVIEHLIQGMNLKEEDARQRVLLVSAGPGSADPGVSDLRAALSEVFEGRRSALQTEHRARAGQRLIPRLLEALGQHRESLVEPPAEFEKRKAILENELERQMDERRRQEERLANLRRDLQADLILVCDRHRPSLAGAHDDTALNAACAAFVAALERVLVKNLESFEQDVEGSTTGVDVEIKEHLKGVNRTASFGKVVATAALTAWVAPGASAAATAVEAGAGAAVQAAAESAASANWTGKTKGYLRSAAAVVSGLNPVNLIGDMMAKRVKDKFLDGQLAGVAETIATQTSREIERSLEREVFGPIAARLRDLRSNLDQVSDERMNDAMARKARVALVDADIIRVKKVASQ